MHAADRDARRPSRRSLPECRSDGPPFRQPTISPRPRRAIMSDLFEAILGEDDAARATVVVNDLLAHGFHGSLTGSLAIAAHLRARGRRAGRRPLRDIDFVVEGFTAIPESLADRF